MFNLLFIFLLFVGNSPLLAQPLCVAETDSGTELFHNAELPLPSWQDVGMRDILVLINEVNLVPHSLARPYQQYHLFPPLYLLPELVVARYCSASAPRYRRPVDYYVYFLDRLRL